MTAVAVSACKSVGPPSRGWWPGCVFSRCWRRCLLHPTCTWVHALALASQGTAHPLVERERLGLRGLLPPRVLTMEQQKARALDRYWHGQDWIDPSQAGAGVGQGQGKG